MAKKKKETMVEEPVVEETVVMEKPVVDTPKVKKEVKPETKKDEWIIKPRTYFLKVGNLPMNFQVNVHNFK